MEFSQEDWPKGAGTELTQSVEAPIEATADEDDQRSIDVIAESRSRHSQDLDQPGEPENRNVVDDEDEPATSTLRKRKRRGRRAQSGKQEVIEFLPAGGSFSQGNTLGGDLQVEESTEMSFHRTMQSEADDDALAWGGDAKTKIESKEDIRSQGDASPKTLDGDGKVHMESKDNVQISSEPAQCALDRKQQAESAQHVGSSAVKTSCLQPKTEKDAMSGVPTHPEMRIGPSSVVDYIILSSMSYANWCGLLGGQDTSAHLALTRLECFEQRLSSLIHDENQTKTGFAQKEVHNAEVDYNYCVYYPEDKAWRPPPSANKRGTSKLKSLTKPQQWRWALWHLVEKSMKIGKLEQIKDGTLVATEIPLGISEAIESRVRNINKQEGSDDDDLHDAQIVEVQERSMGSTSKSPEQMMINVSNGIVKETASQGDQNNLEWKSRQEGQVSSADNTAPTALPDNVDLDSGSEEGEVAEYASQSESSDAMLHYSSSAGFSRAPPGPQQHGGPSDLHEGGRALRDLSPEAFNKQLRYFHVTKLAEEVDLRLPVQCLACGGVGHDSKKCEKLKCSSCGAYDKHITIRCPTRMMCSKCRERGHSESSCPYKLKQISLDEVTCDLCELKGHVEDDCELMWRTSGQIWGPRLFADRQILFYCYECGDRGHLGNDCQTRRPGKGLGSSSWSMIQNFDAPLRSEQNYTQAHSHPPRRPKRQPKGERAMEMKIKGRAHKQAPMHPPEILPDRGNFLHTKKVAAPIRKAKIQINASTSQRLTEVTPSHQFSLISQPFGGYGSKQQPQHADYPHVHDPGYSGEAGLARYNHGSPMYDGHYEGRRGRSRSPPKDSPRDYRGDRYQSGQPPPSRVIRHENVYRPTPSAAHNAYIRHRM